MLQAFVNNIQARLIKLPAAIPAPAGINCSEAI